MKAVRLGIQIFAIVIFLVCLIWTNISAVITAGSIIGTLGFGSLLAVSIFYRQFFSFVKRMWGRVLGKILIISVSVVIAFLAGVCVYFTVQMVSHVSKPIAQINCVVVLGCQVNGDTPSTMLKNRLDIAAPLLWANPEAVCIVTGGMGRGENITEAEAMKQYLMDCSIAEERIYKEESATSTLENFRFSAEILDELSITDGIAVVTTDFHQYRAMLYAEECGLQSTGHYSSRTRLRSLLNNWIREWAALMFA